MRFALLALVLLALMTEQANADMRADKNYRVGIQWNNPATCSVSNEATSAFIKAYGSAAEATVIAAGKQVESELAPCFRTVSNAAASYAQSNFGYLTDQTINDNLADLAYVMAQVELVLLNASVRVRDYDTATKALKTINDLYHLSDKWLYKYKGEFAEIHSRASTAAGQIPGFSP
jgi:hypothetical protein